MSGRASASARCRGRRPLGSRGKPVPGDRVAVPGALSSGAWSRRDVAVLAASVLFAAASPAAAVDPGDFKAVFAETTGGKTPQMGRVTLTMPELAENGNSVSTLIDVQSPMTATDHVKTISLLAEKNPTTLIFRVHLGPRSGRARVATNVRLADTQRVVAVAEMSDGSLWMGEARVLVTLAACVDGG